jgi:hypothetical protein
MRSPPKTRVAFDAPLRQLRKLVHPAATGYVVFDAPRFDQQVAYRAPAYTNFKRDIFPANEKTSII